MNDETGLFGITSQQVAAAAANLDSSLPRGEARYRALSDELTRLFGSCNGFTGPGLSAFEDWTGYKIRGEPALPL